MADKKNVEGISLPDIDLKANAAACDALAAALLAKAKDAELWYAREKEGKKWRTLVIRGLGIFMAGLAPVLPIAASLVPASWEPSVDIKKLAGVSSLLLAAAAGTVVLDKFYGWSSGWMRYVRAMLDLEAKNEEFQLAWRRARLALAPGVEPSPLALQPLLDLLAGFVRDLNELLRKETEEWIGEFGKSLGEAQRYVESQKAPRAEELRGALQVQLLEFEKLQRSGFTLQVGARPARPVAGANMLFEQLEPGIVGVVLSGTIDSKVVRSEVAATVVAGQVATAKLELT